MTAFGNALMRFEAAGAQVLGVSYDDPDTQRKFAIRCAAAFPFLSDSGGRVAKAYQSEGGFGPLKAARRRTFLIDKEGIIRRVYEGMPDVEGILKDLATGSVQGDSDAK